MDTNKLKASNIINNLIKFLLVTLVCINKIYAQTYSPYLLSDSAYDYRISPDDNYVVYTSSAGLYSVPITGDTPLRLNPVTANSRLLGYKISPDSKRIIYQLRVCYQPGGLCSFGDDYSYELYSVPISGGTIAKLNAASSSNVEIDYNISSDSSYLVYKLTQEIDYDNSTSEFYMISVDAGPAIKLSDNVSNYIISPDSRHIIYRADPNTDSSYEVYSMPVDSNPTIKLDDSVSDFKISPDSTRVIYSADLTTGITNELYSASITGGQKIKLDDSVDSFKISPDSRYVVYDIGDSLAFYSTPSLGGNPARLHANPITKSRVEYTITKDSKHVVFSVDHNRTISGNFRDIHSAPIIGGGSIKITTTIRRERFLISPDSKTIVYVKNYTSLFSQPISGGNEVSLGDIEASPRFLISEDSKRVVFRKRSRFFYHDLYSVPLSGGIAAKLNPTLTRGATVSTDFSITPDNSRVIYRADLYENDKPVLFSAPLKGGLTSRINTPDTEIDIYTFNDPIYRITRNSAFIVFRTEGSSSNKLFAAMLPEIPPADEFCTPIKTSNGKITPVCF